MSNSKLSPKEQEELNKLEHAAIIELYQIIALAQQIQDIDYLDSMISAWESKYKKILNNPSPEFKKKIEQLRNYTYFKVVEYILSQIKFKEQKMIENQRKALKMLYGILADNYDYDIVMDKIKKWESKYPYDSFLKMYQKRIDSEKREKNILQHAFKQEEAFKDLYYGVVNRSGTIEELKEYLHKWEEKYYINDKFTIDHFIKNQSEVKRYMSDDFLISIAKKEEHILEDDTINKTTDSSPNSQNAAFKELESILKGKHTTDEVFNWVYKNNSIKFNDYYKQRIISATALDYSPKYLKTLPTPNIDLTKNVLSIDQYYKMDEIKRYAILSYFNLLLPQSQAISNNFFTNHIKTIYTESEKRKHSDIINTFKDKVTTFIHETPKEEKEIDSDLTNIDTKPEHITDSESELNNSTDNTKTSDVDSDILDIENLIASEEDSHTVEIVSSSKTEDNFIELSVPSESDTKDSTIDIKESTISETKIIDSNAKPVKDYKIEATEFITADSNKTETVEPITADDDKIKTTEFASPDIDKPKKSDTILVTVSTTEIDLSEEKTIIYESTTSSTDVSTSDSPVEEAQPNIDYDTILAFSPVFFEAINNYSIQANLIQSATAKANKKNKTKTSVDKSSTITKIRNQSE